MVVAPVADVFAVARGVGNVEGNLSGTILRPSELQGFVEGTLDIFWEVTTAASWLLADILLDFVNIRRELCDIEPIVVLHVSVGHKGHSDLESGIVFSDRVNDLVEGVLRSLDPRVHRASAV